MRRGILWAACAVAAIICGPGARAEAQFKMRASVDTSLSHARTQSVADYLKKVQERSGGRIETELFHSGQLYRDRDVVKALRQGSVEMAAPGNWVLTGLVPDADVFQLPIFFGQLASVAYGAADGKIGQLVDTQFQQKLQVKILGRWLPLGYQNCYSTSKPIKSFDDWAGMKIRNSGGAGQSLRAKFFGAIPNLTAWPDVPLALSQGTFDGLCSTDESLASAKLWEAGVKYGFEDHEFIGFYVPMISDRFFKQIPADLQKIVFDTWQENIETYRKNMEMAQEEAHRTLEKNGVQFFSPGLEALSKIRQKMMPTQDDVAKELRLSAPLMSQIKAESGNLSQ